MAYKETDKAKSHLYGTPKWVLDRYLPKEYLDVAPFPWDKSKWDGLEDDWDEKLVNYCNPNFDGLARNWSKKVHLEAVQKHKKVVLMFPILAKTQKTRDVRTSNFPPELRRDLCSEVQW